MERLIAATKNKGKINEIKQVLSGLPLDIISMSEAGIDIDVVEDGATFEENSLKKALEICKVSKSMVLADDSGLEVDFLGGAPGIYSARFAGPGASDTDKNNKLLKMLKDVPFEKRTARFVCAIAVAFPHGRHFVVRGTCEGFIDFECKGSNGFGYDPLFFIQQYNKTMAEIDADLKNQISHRAKALALMQGKLQKYL
ncbi:XTP/dITP diphosphatase [Ruminiclostridium cellulolyticum]|uniref:dITP/XTP pyrophosphatase n=1 Tax=Ruminiclostridium cellulolyticum (strain ATCC 35319 / DSM 5812 / JCM 6584 / H10) TaxID=394503 RepID=B8I1A9_RUMCH|nr:XTP/dITP diphosphatase [Ruminiclostridium cellulolyticum]ACL75707.1 non-canonical purine NTP pyrophosphatase, rdgB/HAM1 family [Ruminiclostridium cellulolyticum H10]